MFQAQVLELPTVAFLVDVFAGNSGNQGFQSSDPPELIGSCYIMPKHFKSTTGWYIFKSTLCSLKNHTFAFMLQDRRNGLKCAGAKQKNY